MEEKPLRKAVKECKECLIEDIREQVAENLEVLVEVILEREAMMRKKAEVGQSRLKTTAEEAVK